MIPNLSLLDSPPDLRAIFDDFGLHAHDQIIAYCHDGAKSSLAAVSLIDAGYDNVSLYYLSYLIGSKIPRIRLKRSLPAVDRDQ